MLNNFSEDFLTLNKNDIYFRDLPVLGTNKPRLCNKINFIVYFTSWDLL